MKEHLAEEGLALREGTIMDASSIGSPSSRKHREREGDPEMKHTKKGNQWRYSMKLHIGVDDQTGVAHRVVTTAAKMQPGAVRGGAARRRRTCLGS
ncbi:transposase [Candidatus Synechococcus spongiarum]|uniref:transposase n=1 Tax=Candidatus Synechococcus spongiarum TaxID=431041 RepID=UPI00356B6305